MINSANPYNYLTDLKQNLIHIGPQRTRHGHVVGHFFTSVIPLAFPRCWRDIFDMFISEEFSLQLQDGIPVKSAQTFTSPEFPHSAVVMVKMYLCDTVVVCDQIPVRLSHQASAVLCVHIAQFHTLCACSQMRSSAQSSFFCFVKC